jgi:hypothetical protein
LLRALVQAHRNGEGIAGDLISALLPQGIQLRQQGDRLPMSSRFAIRWSRQALSLPRRRAHHPDRRRSSGAGADRQCRRASGMVQFFTANIRI